MASHSDMDHARRQDFLKELEMRAEIMSDLGKNTVTARKTIRSWQHDGLNVAELEPDMSGVLRISIGGGEDTPVKGDYCRFRGDQSKCIRLLEKALEAMKSR